MGLSIKSWEDSRQPGVGGCYRARRISPGPGKSKLDFFSPQSRENPHGLNSNIVLGIAEDEQSRIWVGTQGGGLHRLTADPSIPDSFVVRHWSAYNSNLPTENIFNLGIDQQNQLWLSTDRGLISFEIQTEEVKSYSLPSQVRGLGVETELGLQGHQYVGDSRNIFRFLPDEIRKNGHIPPIFITDILIRDKSVPIRNTFGDSLAESSPLLQAVPYTSSLCLAYDQRDLTFVFSCPEFCTIIQESIRLPIARL